VEIPSSKLLPTKERKEKENFYLGSTANVRSYGN
jgi:hypothetical protein